MKKYSKIIALAAVIVIAVVVTIVCVYFNSIEKGNEFTLGNYVVTSEGNGVSIVGYNGEETSLIIPAKIEGKKVVSIAAEAFNKSKLTQIGFADDAQNVKISEKAFSGNTVVVNVKFPSGMTYVPNYCFYGCTALESVSLSENITYIGTYAFYNCSSLTKEAETEDGYRWFDIPQSVTEICDYAFYGCSNLDGVAISDKLVTIGNSAFRESGLQKLAVYNEDQEYSIKTIGTYAFYKTYIYSKSTEELYMPKLEAIGSYAFASTSNNFQYFRIPKTVTMIGDYAFSGSSSLREVIFEQELDTEELGVGKYAFAYDTSLTKVALSAKVTEIPEGMFMGCIKLLTSQDLVLSENTSSIGNGAFAIFNSVSTNSKTLGNYTIKFHHKNDSGVDEPRLYNDNFMVTKLINYYSGDPATAKYHFILTDYDNTELYAYVGMFADSTNSYVSIDGTNAESFKLLQNMPISKIKSYAFAGVQFTKLCLPADVSTIEDNAFNGSIIEYVYFDSNSINKNEFTIGEKAFNGINLTGSKTVTCYVIGRGNANKIVGSALYNSLNALGIEIEAADNPN